MATKHMAAKRMHKSVVVAGLLFGVFFGVRSVWAVNYSSGLYNAGLYSATPADTTAPSRSAGSPSGTLASGTTSTGLSLSTDEAATCRYSTTMGVAYASMGTTFSTTGGTNHSTNISSLIGGQSYNYYVRCIDGLDNANAADYTISFSVTPGIGATNSTPRLSGSVPTKNILVSSCTFETAFSPLTGERCPQSITISPTATLLGGIRSLSWKTTGEDVRALQHYLNTHGYPVAPSGVGSLGKETTYFGLATKAALIKFQIAHKILPATGTYGPKSKAFVKLNP